MRQQYLGVCNVPRAFEDKIVMEPVEEAVVKPCSILDQHYRYTAPREGASDDEVDEYFNGNDIENELLLESGDSEF